MSTIVTPSPLIPSLDSYQHFRWLIDACSLNIHLLRFDAQAFDIVEYNNYSIDLPQKIAASMPKRQAEYFFGRLAARHALSEYGLQAWDVGTGHLREPLWPPQTIGSITQNHRHCAAVALAAGPWHGVGIDLESPVGPEAEESIAAVALSSVELARLHSMSSPLPLPLRMLLTLVFSAKESFYKATSAQVGRYFDFDAIRINSIDTQHRRIGFSVVEALSPTWMPGTVGHVHYQVLACGDVLTAFVW